MPDRRRSRHDGDVVHQGQERRLTTGRRRAALHALALHGVRLLAAPGRNGRRTSWTSRPPSITAGKIFDAASVPAPSLTPATTGGTLASGAYSYDVTAVLASGAEVPGTVASTTIASGLTNKITVSWSAYTGATSYNVYGRDGGGLRLLKNVTAGTSYVDTGPTKLTANPLTLPSATIGVADTSNFNAGANTIAFGASGPVTCTGTTSRPASPAAPAARRGSIRMSMPVYNASSARPPRATLSVSLALDLTPANTSQRFVLIDNIVLRNSQPF